MGDKGWGKGLIEGTQERSKARCLPDLSTREHVALWRKRASLLHSSLSRSLAADRPQESQGRRRGLGGNLLHELTLGKPRAVLLRKWAMSVSRTGNIHSSWAREGVGVEGYQPDKESLGDERCHQHLLKQSWLATSTLEMRDVPVNA